MASYSDEKPSRPTKQISKGVPAGGRASGTRPLQTGNPDAREEGGGIKTPQPPPAKRWTMHLSTAKPFLERLLAKEDP